MENRRSFPPSLEPKPSYSRQAPGMCQTECLRFFDLPLNGKEGMSSGRTWLAVGAVPAVRPMSPNFRIEIQTPGECVGAALAGEVPLLFRGRSLKLTN